MKAGMNPYAARDIFVGTMDHIVTRWLLKDMSYSLFDNLDSVFDLMVSAFLENHAKVSAAPQERGAEPPVKTEDSTGGYNWQQQPRDQEVSGHIRDDHGLVLVSIKHEIKKEVKRWRNYFLNGTTRSIRGRKSTLTCSSRFKSAT
jgi:hypothetical protein